MISLLSVISTLLAMAFIYAFFQRNKRRRSNAPEVKGPHFFSCKYAELMRDPVKFVQESRKEKGDVFEVTDPLHLSNVVMVTGDKGRDLVLNDPEKKLSYLKAMERFAEPIIGKFPEMTEEEKSDRNSRVMAGILARLKYNEANAQFTINKVCEEFANKDDCDLVKFVEDLVLSVNLSNFLGEDVMEQYEKIIKLLIEMHKCGLQPLTLILPNLPFGPSKRMREITDELKSTLRPYIQKRMEHKDEYDDYITIWTQTPHTTGPNKGKDYTEEEIMREILYILFAANINTTSAVFWHIAELYKHDQVLDKLREELRELNNMEKDPNFVQQSPYLNQCIKESLRMHAVDLFTREVKSECVHEGYLLKKGAMIACPNFIDDEDKISDFENYNPDRWENNHSFTGAISSFATFGGGKHRCKGDTYALQFLRSITSALVLDWNVKIEGLEGVDKIVCNPSTRPSEKIPLYLTKLHV